MNRAGSYGFFVAYQKTDNSWVTNVPADAGVSNTASVVVGRGTPNPMVSPSLTLSPGGGPYSLNQTLTAQFSITNRGTAPITLQQIGRASCREREKISVGGVSL